MVFIVIVVGLPVVIVVVVVVVVIIIKLVFPPFMRRDSSRPLLPEQSAWIRLWADSHWLLLHRAILRHSRFMRIHPLSCGSPQWGRTAKNRDISTGPLAHPFARTAHSFACSHRSLIRLLRTASFALLALLVRSAALICLLACSFTHSRVCGRVNF